jgi:hypothetical protein
VIHNFYELYQESEIEAQIKKDIENSFKVDKIDYQVGGVISKIWIDKSYNSTNPIIHLVMGNDKTTDKNVVEKYNNFCIHTVKEEIRS